MTQIIDSISELLLNILPNVMNAGCSSEKGLPDSQFRATKRTYLRHIGKLKLYLSLQQIDTVLLPDGLAAYLLFIVNVNS
jgi:hypothetical protein